MPTVIRERLDWRDQGSVFTNLDINSKLMGTETRVVHVRIDGWAVPPSQSGASALS